MHRRTPKGIFVFVIRQSKPEDAATLQKLARMVYFINLPPDERLILEKIQHSQRCFERVATTAGKSVRPERDAKRDSRQRGRNAGMSSMEQDSDLFMFTILDGESGGILGTSQVRARMGGPGNPNWGFKITEKTFRSEQLGWGTTHKVGQLHGDETGPTEIGGLILTPSHRGHKGRPGRFLSFVRFHFMGLFRELFSARIIAEMAPPVTADGENLFWDAFGRKFIPVKYAEADRFCQHNRAFISELLPKEEIYLSLLPLEVQNQVGAVSKETVPARRLLESLGFAYKGIVDPFDTGPHLEAAAADVSLVRDTRRAKLGRAASEDRCTTPVMLSAMSPEGEFRAVETLVDDDDEEVVRVPRRVMDSLMADEGTAVGLTLMQAWVRKDDDRAPQGSGASTGDERLGPSRGRSARGTGMKKRPAAPSTRSRTTKSKKTGSGKKGS